MKYGYDTNSKHLFSWDGEFHFEGIVDMPPEGAFYGGLPEEAAAFLSGWKRVVVARWDDSQAQWSLCVHDKRMRRICALTADEAKDIVVTKNLPVAVCGRACSSPSEVAGICHWLPSASIYICPVTDGIEALGAVIAASEEKRPRRASLYVPVKEAIDAPSIMFEPKMDGDGLGRMAQLVKTGMPVFNEMMRGVGVSPFYGNVIHNIVTAASVFIVRMDAVTRLFPAETISAKMYAATTVPVRMRASDRFKEETGCVEESVDVVVSSENIPGLPQFMTFYRIMAGKDFVCVSYKNEAKFTKFIPVFRYNGAYRVGKDSSDVKRFL